MKAKHLSAQAPEKGLVRSLVRRGSVSDRSPAVAKRVRRLRGTTMCERCGSIYREKRWLSATPAEKAWPIGLTWTVCPACRQAEDLEFFGRVLIRLDAPGPDEVEIRRRMANVAERAQWTQSQRRILSVERAGDQLEVLTTSQKLAHRIVRSLRSAFGGTATYDWSDHDGELRATWRWNARTSRTRAERKARASRATGAIDLEVQARHIAMEPRWRDLIEESTERWADRYPELLRVHATLQHGRHRHGSEQVSLVANYPKHTLRVEKQGEAMEDAIHAACLAMSRELHQAREGWKRFVKAPRVRLERSDEES
jgi:ribosome-associated translation inhibitor RaiA